MNYVTTQLGVKEWVKSTKQKHQLQRKDILLIRPQILKGDKI